jgi:hypothetical protein
MVRLLAASILLAPALALAQEAPAPREPEPTGTAAVGEAPPAPPAEEASASTPVTTKSLKLQLSGVLFASWGLDIAAARPGADGQLAGNHRFDIGRAYINIEPHLTDRISLRITPDITRFDDDGYLAFRLKYAYATFDEVLPGVAVKAGMQHTAFIDFDNSVWKYRVLGQAALQYFTGKPSSDLGIGLTGKHLDGLLEYQLVLANGEGYSRAERSPAYPEGDGKYKDLGVRLTVTPFARRGGDAAGLKLTGFGQYGIGESARIDGVRHRAESTRLLGMASFEHRWFTVAAAYGLADDLRIEREDDVAVGTDRRPGRLFTAFGFVNLPLNLRFLGRYDAFDPDVDEANDQRSRTIAGVAYRFSEQVQVIADWQHFGYGDGALGEDPGAGPVGDQLFLHLEAKY